MKPVILIHKDNTELLTNSSLCLIKGEVGSGKSRLAMNIMVGLSGVSDNLGLEYIPCPIDLHVIYVSTEMSKYHLGLRYSKIINSTSIEYRDKLKFLDMCMLSIDDKFKDLKEACALFKPYVLIIDQLADFVNNVNDIEQANNLVKKLMEIMELYDCAIIGILHQNEDSGITTKARGHIGSVAEQKVVSSIAIAANSYGFKIQTTKLREGKQLRIDATFDESTGMLTQKDPKVKFDYLLTHLKFPSNASDLDNQIAKLINKSVATARNLKKEMLDENLIVSTKDGKSEVYNKI